MKTVNNHEGFTLIELIVTMAVSSIIVLSLVGMVTALISSTAVMGTRNGLPEDLQTGLQKIASLVRSSDNVLLYNLTPDDKAPLAKEGEAADVPGPSDTTDEDHEYFWRSTSHQLVMSQPSRGEDGNAIYNNPAHDDFTGPRDSIVLYVRGKALYQRTIYTDHSALSTHTCADVIEAGGCSDDIKLVDNIKLVDGVPQFTVIYLDSAGVEIPAKLSNDANNYQARKTTKAIKVDLTLEVAVGSRKLTAHDTSTISFRNAYVPGSSVIGSNNGSGVGSGAVAPPWSMVGNIYAGPGGLSLAGLSSISGTGLNVVGQMAVNKWSNIGTVLAPMTITVGNQACGTTSSVPAWPAPCLTEPIPGLSKYSTTIYGNVCATGQTTTYGMVNAGLVASCVAPPVLMPTYDRQGFLDSMKTQQPPSNGSCSSTNFTPKTLGPNIIYMGSLTNDWLFCKMTIKGNIYIKGDFISNTILSMTVDESVGVKRPLVIVEGDIQFNSLLEYITPNSYGTGIDFISFKSANADCLTTPGCRERTDMSLLYNSYNIPTIKLSGISAPGSTFYAYYGAAQVDSLTSVGAVSGQTLTIGGLATVNAG